MRGLISDRFLRRFKGSLKSRPRTTALAAGELEPAAEEAKDKPSGCALEIETAAEEEDDQAPPPVAPGEGRSGKEQPLRTVDRKRKHGRRKEKQQ